MRRTAISPRRVASLGLTPTVFVALSAFVLLMLIAHDVASVMRLSATVQADALQARAQIVAETVLVRAVAERWPAGTTASVGGTELAVHHTGDRWFAEVRSPHGASHWFTCQELPGAAPLAFGNQRSATDAVTCLAIGARLIAAADGPRLDEAALAGAPRIDLVTGTRRDQAVALRHWPAGTDRDDYVWCGKTQPRGIAVPGDLVVVPGHLWIETSHHPLEIDLRRDLVVVVQGNLYLGRSVQVRGGGRLLFATQVLPGTTAFADRDGSGCWSAADELRCADQFTGPIEGCGNVYLGLPGRSAVVRCDAGLAIAGELHIASRAVVAGPLVLSQGITLLGSDASLEPGGEWRFRPGRERVPGFVVAGGPRPGLLCRLDGAPSVPVAAAAADQQLPQLVLYASPGGR